MMVDILKHAETVDCAREREASVIAWSPVYVIPKVDTTLTFSAHTAAAKTEYLPTCCVCSFFPLGTPAGCDTGGMAKSLIPPFISRFDIVTSFWLISNCIPYSNTSSYLDQGIQLSLLMMNILEEKQPKAVGKNGLAPVLPILCAVCLTSF